MAHWVIVTIIVLVVFPIVLLAYIATTSKEDSFWERIGQAINYLIRSISNQLTAFISGLTEPKDKKRARLAKETIASRNATIYDLSYATKTKEVFNSLLKLDDSFKQSLDILGLSEEDWKKLATHLFYMGQIHRMSRRYPDYSQQICKSEREEELTRSDRYSILHAELLKEGLMYFNIPLQEWIDLGDIVLERHGVYESRLVKEYGFMTMKHLFQRLG